MIPATRGWLLACGSCQYFSPDASRVWDLAEKWLAISTDLPVYISPAIEAYIPVWP